MNVAHPLSENVTQQHSCPDGFFLSSNRATFPSAEGRTQGRSGKQEEDKAPRIRVNQQSCAFASDQAKGARDGIPGQDAEVHRLRFGFCFYRRRTTIFSRQTIQERAEALQGVQNPARFSIGCCTPKAGIPEP
jgi:hypothetical protein